MKKIFFALLGIWCASCVKDDNFNAPNYAEIENKMQKNAEIFDGNSISFTHLKTKVSTQLSIYNDNDTFEGVVISSDEEGNFYKKIYVQALDNSGGISIFIEKKGTFASLPIGSKVQIRLKDVTIWFNNRYNCIEIGYGQSKTSSGNIKIANIPPSLYSKIIIPTGEILSLTQISTSFNDIKSLNKQKFVNQLITVKNIQFETKAIGKTFHLKSNNYNTSYNLEDSNGFKLAFLTSSFANFSKEIIPNGQISITGVLTQYNSSYQFNISTLKHIQTSQN